MSRLSVRLARHRLLRGLAVAALVSLWLLHWGLFRLEEVIERREGGES
ncbi:MAG TPA: hypothetical protein VEB22_15600 [Phycisphaerales bacterium]|nr:hypothetical protein [Phycisphaerales bacterium]